MQAGEARTSAVADLEFGAPDLFGVALWIRTGPDVGAEIATRSLDTDALATKAGTARVVRMRQTLGDGIPMQVFDVELEQPEDGTSAASFDATGRMISVEFGGLFEMRLEPESVAKDIVDVQDLFVDGIVRVDSPLGAARRVRRLRLGLDQALGAAIGEAPGQRLEKQEDGTYVLEVTSGGGPHPRATDEETQSALEATLEFPAGHASVQALAERAVGAATAPAEKVGRLVAFVSKYVRDGHRIAGGGVLDVIRDPVGDCTEHADLLTVLCRAAGLPCRNVGGLAYMGDDERAFGGHAWNEVILDGRWVPVDATWNEVTTNATHVRYPIVKNDHLSAMSAVRGKTLRVLAVELAPE